MSTVENVASADEVKTLDGEFLGVGGSCGFRGFF